jgi:AcrR family transcriptional regulator
MNKNSNPSISPKDQVKKTDLRVIKTKRAIYQALIELLRKKGINKITVSELAGKAEINKGTFYLHYSDIRDLYENALKKHLGELVNQMDFMELFITDPTEFSKRLVMSSFDKPIFERDAFFAKENRPFNQSAQLYFCNALATKVLESTIIPASAENEIKLKFIFSGSGALLRYDSEENAKLIISIISRSIKTLFPEFYSTYTDVKATI